MNFINMRSQLALKQLASDLWARRLGEEMADVENLWGGPTEKSNVLGWYKRR